MIIWRKIMNMLWIWFTGSDIKNNKQYFYYWIPPKDCKFYTEGYWFYKQKYFSIKHSILRYLTPFFNMIKLWQIDNSQEKKSWEYILNNKK